jgi:hypothetical protein
VNKYEYNPELLLEILSIIISNTTKQLIHCISDTKDSSHISHQYREGGVNI